MYTEDKCRCMICFKKNTSFSPPKWALIGGLQGNLVFSDEASQWQFDTLSTDSRSPIPVPMDIMPNGTGVCFQCYVNIKSNFRNLLEAIKITEMMAEQINAKKVSPKSDVSSMYLYPLDPVETMKQMAKNKNTSWLWPRTPRGWKLIVRQRAFSGDICQSMCEGVDLAKKSISWVSETTSNFENGQIDSYNIKTRLCNVSRQKDHRTITRSISPSVLFPPNATKQCTKNCYCAEDKIRDCVKAKCCIFCQNLSLSCTDGPGYKWYCTIHPVEKFFVPGSADRSEISAWMYEDNHRRGETLSVIDPESSIGIALYGRQREVVLAECKGASISTIVNVSPKPAKMDMCHECKKESYHGRICPSTGDSNWYCDGCWDKYWIDKKQYEKEQHEDFPPLS